MTPERWQQVSDLFASALERGPREAAAFLEEACGDDAELRAEVESLLCEHARAGEFLSHPASAGAASALREVAGEDRYLGTTVGGRYRIEALLAAGGQALVYRASDLTVLSKPVVVKILSVHAGRNPWLRKKFRQEMEALSRIDHPGVVGILDTGELPGGTPFLVIQYVEGVTLRQALDEGPFDLRRAAAILRQIGAALQAAHAIGVAHRDLKPENIMLQRLGDGGERVKLIDFGIAKVEKSAVGPDTTTAMVAGTVRYMAPEQFQGENSRASDIYALARVACEMISGRPEAEALSRAVPRRVKDMIRPALAYRPKDRPANAEVFCNRLADALTGARRISVSRRVVIAGAGLAALGAALAVIQRGPRKTDPGPVEVHRLAILPFQMLGPSSGMEPLGLGIADGLITRLSNLSGLIVRPVSAVRRYAGATADPVQAGRDLQVDAVVEGTLQTADGGIRAGVRLIRPSDGKALWAGTIESAGARLFTLEDSIAQQVALNLAIRLTDAERRGLAVRRRLHPQAHELYVQGRYEWGKRSREGFENAAGCFRRALDLDPAYPRALAGLADCYLLLGGYSYYPQLEMLPQAKRLAARALELDPSLGEAHATLGLITQNLDWDWGRTESHYRKAIALAPGYATGHHWYAEFESILGRFEHSRREFARAREIDPLSPIIQTDEAQLYFFEREFDRSLAMLRQVTQLDPAFELAHERIATIRMVQGREDDAWKEAQFLHGCREGSGDCREIWTAWLPGRNPAAAREALLRLEAESRRRRIPPAALVVAHARQGEPERALDWLEYMLEKHEVSLITAKVNPLFDPLRRHPRFQEILRRLHLAG